MPPPSNHDRPLQLKTKHGEASTSASLDRARVLNLAEHMCTQPSQVKPQFAPLPMFSRSGIGRTYLSSAHTIIPRSREVRSVKPILAQPSYLLGIIKTPTLSIHIIPHSIPSHNSFHYFHTPLCSVGDTRVMVARK